MRCQETMWVKSVRLRSDRRGAAAMEFALILPVMTLMLLGLAQYATLMFTYDSMLNAARSGSRAMAVGALTESQVVDKLKAILPGWVPAADWTVVAQDASTTGTNQVITTISVPSSKATIMSYVPMPDTINVQVAFKKDA